MIPQVRNVRPFDLEATLNSGQVFHWSPSADGFVAMLGDMPAFARQPDPETVEITAEDPEAVAHFLALDHDIAALGSAYDDDPPLREAFAFCPGIRILRQPPWECLATFITSSLKQVAHIRQISLKLRERFGERFEFEPHGVLFAYPKPKVLAEAGEVALRECGLGYRAKSVHRAAEAIASGEFDLAAGESLGDAELVQHLCQLHGVGEKIANCAALFGFGRLEAFPIDVWVERVLTELYFDGKSIKPKELRAFVDDHFGEKRGYAQQFLFHHARMTQLKPRKGKGD